MRKADAALRERILRVTRETGPRIRNVLAGLNYGGKADFDAVFQAMRAAGELKKYGKKRDAKWGVPGWVNPPRRRFQ